MERTYLDACLKDGLTVRWPDALMPIKVHVAPFRWYEKSKQRESYAYNQIVYDAFDTWSQISGGVIRFQQVASIHDAQMDVSWRRVDRTSLGHCEYLVSPQSLLYSASIKIGVSDGRVHAEYNDIEEVRHTILHEIGHGIGLLGHSDGEDDIMFVPHRYGVMSLSPRDGETVRALYKLPTAFDYVAIGRKFQLPEPFTIHEVLNQLEGRQHQSPDSGKTIDFLPSPSPENPDALRVQHDILSQMGKFHLATQHISVNRELKKSLLPKRPLPPASPS